MLARHAIAWQDVSGVSKRKIGLFGGNLAPLINWHNACFSFRTGPKVFWSAE
jgi:hypothetical protein